MHLTWKRILPCLLALAIFACLVPAAQAGVRMPGVVSTRVQSISQTIAHTGQGHFTDDTTITSVDVKRTLIFPKSLVGYAAFTPGYSQGSLLLQSATVVRWHTWVGPALAESATLKADVVTFADAFKSIQYVSGSATSQTINAVNTAKTFILSMNWSSLSNNELISPTLTNSTTVSLPGAAQTYDVAFYWVVVETY